MPASARCFVFLFSRPRVAPGRQGWIDLKERHGPMCGVCDWRAGRTKEYRCCRGDRVLRRDYMESKRKCVVTAAAALGASAAPVASSEIVVGAMG